MTLRSVAGGGGRFIQFSAGRFRLSSPPEADRYGTELLSVPLERRCLRLSPPMAAAAEAQNTNFYSGVGGDPTPAL